MNFFFKLDEVKYGYAGSRFNNPALKMNIIKKAEDIIEKKNKDVVGILKLSVKIPMKNVRWFVDEVENLIDKFNK